MPIHGSREGCVDFGFRAGLQDLELQALCVCCLLRRADDAPGLRIVRVQEQADRLRLRHQLGDQLDPLLPELRVEVGDPGKVAARARETGHQPGLNRVDASHKDDWDYRRRILSRKGLVGAAACCDNVDLMVDKIGG